MSEGLRPCPVRLIVGSGGHRTTPERHQRGVQLDEDLADYISHEFDAGHEYHETWNPGATVAFRQDLVQ